MITLNCNKNPAFNPENVLQLDLFIPPFHADQEYFMAKRCLDIMFLRNKKSEQKEINELFYRIKLYELKYLLNKKNK